MEKHIEDIQEKLKTQNNRSTCDPVFLVQEKERVYGMDLDVAFPSHFCGAVDFGRLKNGKLALVENNLPYACGWYGPYLEGKIYGKWLEEGFKFLT